MARPLASEIANSAASKGLRTAGAIIAGSLFVAVSSHVALPLWFTPVPLTMQPFAVLLLGLLLGPRLVAATLVTYLLEGAAGFPVFTPGFVLGSGMAHLLGPTGGYLMSYPVAAALVSVIWRRSTHGFGAAVLSAAGGDALILLCGFAWLAVWTHGSSSQWSIGSAFSMAVLPFLPGDALKVVAAGAIAKSLDRVRRKH